MEYAADALPLSTQATLLSISRRSLYYQPKPPPPEEVAIKHRIDAFLDYMACPWSPKAVNPALVAQNTVGTDLGKKWLETHAPAGPRG